MQSSDSFSSNSGVLPYLRAYASTRTYNSIAGGDQEDQQRNGAPTGGGRGMLAWRAVGAVAVFLVFAAAVSTSNTRWTASSDNITGRTAATAAAVAGHTSLPRGGHSYRGDFEAFEVSLVMYILVHCTNDRRSQCMRRHTGLSARLLSGFGSGCSNIYTMGVTGAAHHFTQILLNLLESNRCSLPSLNPIW